MFNETIALIASTIMAIDPHTVLYTNIIVTETIFIVTFLFSFLAMLFYIKTHNIKYVLSSAFFLALATLIRPIVLYFPFFMLISILLTNIKIWNRILHSIIFLCLYFVLISSWSYINYIKYDHFAFSTVDGYNIFYIYVAFTEHYKTGRSIPEIRTEMMNDINNKYDLGNNPISANAAIKKYSINYLFKNYKYFIVPYFKGITQLYFGQATRTFCRYFKLPISEFKYFTLNSFSNMLTNFKKRFGYEVIISVIIFIYLITTYIFVGLGIVKLLQIKAYQNLVVLLIPIIYFSIIPGPLGSVRFKLPVIPFYTHLLAYGIYSLKYRREKNLFSFKIGKIFI